MNKLTQAEVKRLFNYRDGVLYWKARSSSTSRVVIGMESGSTDTGGYIQTMVHGKLYLNHRLVFLYHHGYMPENDVDHIDKNKSNNRIENLREVSTQCNMRNSRQPKNNTSGVKGVYWNKQSNGWVSLMRVNNKIKYLGQYHDFVDAVAARLAGEQCVNWNGCDSCSPAYLYMFNYLKEEKDD